MDYEYLRQQYPETISMDQLYRICHISKRKAKWLLENGVIPCIDSGKQTRRFQIRLDDVITFLERRDAGLLQEDIPTGIVSSGGRTLEKPRQLLDSEELRAFFLERWAGFPDVLTVPQTATLSGFGASAINRWFRDGLVDGVCYRGKNLISKESLAEYLASQDGQLIPARPVRYKELLEEFQVEERDNDMNWGSMSL